MAAQVAPAKRPISERRGRCHLVTISDKALLPYLDGRPRDRRVKYRTWYNVSKHYEPNGARECARRRGDTWRGSVAA